MRKAYILFTVLLWALPLRLLPASPLNATNGIRWDLVNEKVDAQIEQWPLAKVLEGIATSTGWQVYVEPDSQRTVSTRFRDLEPAEALRRLLGELNFALLPQTNGPSKLFVYRTTVQGATQLVPSPIRAGMKAKSPKPVPGELIITLKPGAKQGIEELAKRLGAKVVGKIDELNAYRLQFESEEAAQKARDALQDDSDVSSIDNNFAIDRPERPELLGISSGPGFSLKPNVTPNTEHPVIALIDTPVNGDGSRIKEFLLPGISVTGDTGSTPAELTHGTAMAETILRSLSLSLQDADVTKWRILPVDVYGTSSATTTFEVARGIYAALPSGPSIFNLSLGSEADSPFLQRAIEALHQKGILFVAAAGNQHVATPVYPAAYPSVLAVTAGDSRGNIAPYANYGDFVDAIAPGANVVFYNGKYYLITGTSVAASNANGKMAGYLEANPGKTPGDAEAAFSKEPKR